MGIEVTDMSEAFDILSGALEEAIADTRTKALPRRTRRIVIEPLASYSSQDIKAIRQGMGYTQALFAEFFGVSLKTVEAWESGRNKPSGPSRRLLALIANKKISI